jgi:single-strand DNA-binding protein
MANFNFNKVMLGGRLTAKPELKQTLGGIPVCSFSMAVNRRARAGEQAIADFFNVSAWRGTAEFVCKHFDKGSSIFVVGTLQNRSWTDQSGVKRYATDVIADEVSFVDSRSENATAQADQAGAYVPAAYTAPAAAPSFEDVGRDEDLPF